jgi:hypothetical protein
MTRAAVVGLVVVVVGVDRNEIEGLHGILLGRNRPPARSVSKSGLSTCRAT